MLRAFLRNLFAFLSRCGRDRRKRNIVPVVERRARPLQERESGATQYHVLLTADVERLEELEAEANKRLRLAFEPKGRFRPRTL